MKRLAVAALLLSVLTLSACYLPPVWDVGDAINDIKWIKPGVTTKAQVVERLGKPRHVQGERLIYTGRSSYGLVFAAGPTGASGGLIGEKTWYVTIEFDKAGLVRRVTKEPTKELKPAEQRKKLFARAARGDAESQFQLFLRREPPIERRLCLSANGGHGPAQYYIGESYETGRGRIPKDPIRAYQWFALATINGDPTARYARDGVAKKMTPAQIAEAERLVREWKPNPSSCEAKGKAASR